MAEDALTRHRAFVSEIRQKRQIIADEDHRLEIVERFHLDAISELSASGGRSANLTNDIVVSSSPVGSLDSLKRYEACVMAMKQLGGRQKTAAIAKWLVANGAGNEMEEHVFYNACYTAMGRRKEMFRKLKGGEWELIEKAQ